MTDSMIVTLVQFVGSVEHGRVTSIRPQLFCTAPTKGLRFRSPSRTSPCDSTFQWQFPLSKIAVVAIATAIALRSLDAADRITVAGETMGTYYRVTIDSPADADSESALRHNVQLRLAEINSQMSTWDNNSEISKFNRSDKPDWFPVSLEFARVVQEACRIHELSDDAFDPTVSPLIDLWGFGKPDHSGLPSQEQLDAALQSTGMQHIEVRLQPPALRKRLPTVQLNLSAIAKGYAVDALAELLARTERPSFIVDIGGETRAGIAKASGAPWKVGVESPNTGLSQQSPLTRIVPLVESSIATSGDYRNFFEHQGVRYSHTIDPTTGRPVTDPPASVSVIHASCMTADALATAMMVLRPERGIRLANKQGLEVLFQTVDADGNLQQSGTGRFRQQASSETWVLFVAAAVLFLVAVGGMAIGVLISNRQIKGSCGGLAAMPGGTGDSVCDLCSVPRKECVNEELRLQFQKTDAEAEARSVQAQSDS